MAWAGVGRGRGGNRGVASSAPTSTPLWGGTATSRSPFVSTAGGSGVGIGSIGPTASVWAPVSSTLPSAAPAPPMHILSRTAASAVQEANATPQHASSPAPPPMEGSSYDTHARDVAHDPSSLVQQFERAQLQAELAIADEARHRHAQSLGRPPDMIAGPQPAPPPRYVSSILRPVDDGSAADADAAAAPPASRDTAPRADAWSQRPTYGGRPYGDVDEDDDAFFYGAPGRSAATPAAGSRFVDAESAVGVGVATGATWLTRVGVQSGASLHPFHSGGTSGAPTLAREDFPAMPTVRRAAVTTAATAATAAATMAASNAGGSTTAATAATPVSDGAATTTAAATTTTTTTTAARSYAQVVRPPAKLRLSAASRTFTPGAGVAARKAMKARAEQAARDRRAAIDNDPNVMLCSFYQEGRCRKGDDCTFRHSMPDGATIAAVEMAVEMNIIAAEEAAKARAEAIAAGDLVIDEFGNELPARNGVPLPVPDVAALQSGAEGEGGEGVGAGAGTPATMSRAHLAGDGGWGTDDDGDDPPPRTGSSNDGAGGGGGDDSPGFAHLLGPRGARLDAQRDTDTTGNGGGHGGGDEGGDGGGGGGEAPMPGVVASLQLGEGETLADLVLGGISSTERELALQYLERVRCVCGRGVAVCCRVCRGWLVTSPWCVATEGV